MRTLVVEDQPLARERLLALLADDADVDVVGTTATGGEAVEAVRRLAPDLVFLDIHMPELDGMGVVKTVGPDRMPLIIFVTAYDAYAVQAFEVHAVDYLLKPFGRSRVQQALARARARLRRDEPGAMAARLLAVADELRHASPPPGERLIVKSEGRVRFVEIDRIDWVEAEGNYVRLHVGGETHSLRETLASVQARLEESRFFRIHRSRLVNLSRIAELKIGSGGDYEVVLQDGTSLGLSRLYKDALQERLARG